MPLFIGCLAVVFPRLALFLVWLFNAGYVGRAFGAWVWPLLGFFFLPVTTLAFAYAHNALAVGNDLTPLGWLVTLLGLLVDLGVLGGGRRQWRSRRDA